ncbi:DNA ligase I, putative [Schistosoma mansoni]|uniref:DNA ligase I, putative n=1 Tax=Schistosoma mansoni TaxID=6183 RepID=UPI0001A645EA|nr:DNA ligase I, putative [Schistosoma mansoni]|eukprot:XP_018646472.1 DNA ligase I, putative [Schistosoma mansoni]
MLDPKNDINFEESDVEIPSKLPDLVHQQPIRSPTSEDKLLENVTDTRSKDEFKNLSESNLVRLQCAEIEASNILSTSNDNEKSSRSPEKLVACYDPSKAGYHPIHDCNWREGESVPYLSLARTFECIEATSGRIKITEILCNFFRSVGLLSSFDLTSCVYLCLNRLGPAYEGMELGVGETILLKALAATTGVGIEHMRSSLKQHGDLGAVAETIRSRQKILSAPKPLTISSVFSKLKDIASMSGNSAQNKKMEIIRSLLVACRESETKYIIRSLSGKLRIGLAEQTVLTALGQAVAMTPFHFKVSDKSTRIINASNGMSSEQWKVTMDIAVANVKRAYCVCPDYSRLIKALLTKSHESLDQICTITPGIPLKPMLASPTHGIYEILKRFEECDFTCEYKYDGERAQIHILPSGASHVYSRNQEDNTTKYPDIVNNLMSRVLPESKLTPHAIELLSEIVKDNKIQVQSNGIVGNKLESCIIDSEVVAWDRLAGHILPFQVLSTRKRKDVDESTLKVQICIYVFDILFINGISLIEQPLRIRREILREVFPRISGEFMMATSLDSSDTDEIATFLDEAIKGNCEGLMIKTLDRNSTYEIAKRSHSWLKLKKDYLEGVGDTLDLVVIGGFYGTGKRAGRYGGYLLACYDPDTEEYQTICKIGTGMKDDELASFSEFFKNHATDKAKPYYQYTISLIPDQWFEPVQVWEVKAADLSISPGHKAAAGLADPQKGISLRFPRFVRIRDDKKPEDATTAQQVYELYQNQEQIKNQHGNKQTGNNDDEDMY